MFRCSLAVEYFRVFESGNGERAEEELILSLIGQGIGNVKVHGREIVFRLKNQIISYLTWSVGKFEEGCLR